MEKEVKNLKNAGVVAVVKMKGYECPICGLEYHEKIWADKCEKWCREKNSCNLEITRHSMNKGKQNDKK